MSGPSVSFKIFLNFKDDYSLLMILHLEEKNNQVIPNGLYTAQKN